MMSRPGHLSASYKKVVEQPLSFYAISSVTRSRMLLLAGYENSLSTTSVLPSRPQSGFDGQGIFTPFHVFHVQSPLLKLRKSGRLFQSVLLMLSASFHSKVRFSSHGQVRRINRSFCLTSAFILFINLIFLVKKLCLNGSTPSFPTLAMDENLTYLPFPLMCCLALK